MTQAPTFDNEVKRIYFGVDIFDQSGSIVDSFRAIHALQYNDTVVHQWNLNKTFADKKARLSSYTFSFSNGAIPDSKTHSGQIIVRIEETRKLKKHLRTELQANFESQSDAEAFVNKLKEILTTVSTEQNIRTYENGSQSVHYSCVKKGEKTQKNVLISLQTGFHTPMRKVVITSFTSVIIE